MRRLVDAEGEVVEVLAEARGGEEAKKIAEERGSSGRSSGSGGDMHGSGRIALLRLGIYIYSVCWEKKETIKPWARPRAPVSGPGPEPRALGPGP